MRNCPVCESDQKNDLGKYYGETHIFECVPCGMRYLDAGEANQADLDRYYASDTSPDLHGPDSIARLDALAEYIGKLPARAVDIGGTWSPLRFLLPGIETLNAGEELAGEYGLFVISHTLEHVYDVPGLMRSIVAHASPRARLVVEGPVWLDYRANDYDFYWQHCNKFQPAHYAGLLRWYGFEAVEAMAVPDFQGFNCYRVSGVLHG